MAIKSFSLTRPVEDAVESHRVEPGQLDLVLDAGDADEPRARRVLLLQAWKNASWSGRSRARMIRSKTCRRSRSWAATRSRTTLIW